MTITGQDELAGTVTAWLKKGQPLAGWWESRYPGLRAVSRELAARVLAQGDPVDTEGLRYYDYALIGGAIDYRLRMEFTRQWGGDPYRTAFTRAWAPTRGSLAHAAAALLADCAPVLSDLLSGASRATCLLARSLPALLALLEDCATRLDSLAPWDWSGEYARSGREEEWLLDYCLVLAELDDFHRSRSAGINWYRLMSEQGRRGALYASGRLARGPVGAAGGYWRPDTSPPSRPGRPELGSPANGIAGDNGDVREVGRAVEQLVRSWPLLTYLARTDRPEMEGLASVACRGRGRLALIRRDVEAQLALWRQNPARQASGPPRVVAANPTFAGSLRLPADGDIIVRGRDGGGSLIDFKSAKRIEPSGVLVMLRQVLTYALMDERGEYDIRRVGLYFSRYGLWAHWPVEELLDKGMQGGAGTGAHRSLEQHGEGLRRMLFDLRYPEPISVALPPKRD